MAFTNRVSQYPNRKKLTVIDQSVDSSGRTQFIVDEIRNEGSVTASGTELTAGVLTEGIVDLIDAEISAGTLKTVTQTAVLSDRSIATTAYVWAVLRYLGLDKGNGSGGSSSGD